jgi:hypothetical protein
MKPSPDELGTALLRARRTCGWNIRPDDVRRFDVGDCLLIVVPARRWIYRRNELQAAAARARRCAVEGQT